MVATTNPGDASVSVTWYVTGNMGLLSGVSAPVPLKETEYPLPVVAVMLN